MLNWLKGRRAKRKEEWLRVQQLPGTKFPFPKGAKLKPEEEVILALPTALISDNEKIGSVLLCDNIAELSLNEKVGVWYVKLQPGMTFSLSKSCEFMIIGKDDRPQFFQYHPPGTC